MNGEPQNENDLFFTCSLIEYVARSTKNTKKFTVQTLGKENIEKIYELAEVYHSENIDKVVEDFVNLANIPTGEYDVLANCKYRIPTHWEIGRVYQRLILNITNDENNYINTLIQVLSSWIIEKIDNYNSSMYYENPSYLYACYTEGKVL